MTASYFEQGEPYAFMDIPAQYQQVVETNAVLNNGEIIGISSSPGYSYYYRKMLALAYINIPYIELGTDVMVLWEIWAPGKKISVQKWRQHLIRKINKKLI